MSSDDSGGVDPEQVAANLREMGGDAVSTLARAVDRDETSDARVDQLRRVIDALTSGQRASLARAMQEDSSDLFTPFNELEQALGFQATPPAEGDTNIFVDVDGSDFTPPEVRENVMSQLGMTGARDIDYFEAMAESFRSGTLQPGATINQRTLDQIAESDREEFADLAEQRAETLREQQREREREREQEDTQDRQQRGQPDRQQPSRTASDEFERGVDPQGPMDNEDIIVREDWFKQDGTMVQIDPGFVDLFVALARDLGRARDLDLQPDPMKYFELTPESQRKLYDVTPEMFIRRAVSRGDISATALRSRGFPDELIPSRGDIPDVEPRDFSDDDDEEDEPDDRFMGMLG